jgi:hypothetical protein
VKAFCVFNSLLRGVAMKRICLAILLIGLLSTPGNSLAELPAPPGAWATQGTYSNVIIISWDSVEGATGYRLHQYLNYGIFGRENDVIIATLGGPPEYNEFVFQCVSECQPGYTQAFGIHAMEGDIESSLSRFVYGYTKVGAPRYEDGDMIYDLGSSSGGCFIATAVYGSYWEPHVMTLRQFRDAHLLTNKLGTKFVEAYYKYSPPMADYIAEHDRLRSVARIGLAPLVGFSLLAINFGIMTALTILFSLLTMIIGGTYFIVRTKESK